MVAAGEVRVASLTASPLHELLAAVDVVRCSGDRCVRHEVDGDRGDVGRADHAPDRQRRAELLATRVQLIAEQRRRQRRVDEAGCDKVDALGCELERERLGERRHRGGERRDECARGRPATARSADEQERSARAHVADGAALWSSMSTETPVQTVSSFDHLVTQ